jgi:hypothetical protein
MPALKQHANRSKKHVTVYRSGRSPGLRPEVEVYDSRSAAFKGALAAFMMTDKPFEEVLSHLEIKRGVMTLHGPGSSKATIMIKPFKAGEKFEGLEASCEDGLLESVLDMIEARQ